LSSVRKALIYASAAQYLIKALGFASVIVLARIMTPEELGIFAIASSVVMVVTEIRLLGTTNYLVRKVEVTTETISSGIGLTLLICWSLGALVFFSASYVGGYYEIPALVSIFKILSISFIFAPFISVTSAILTREMKFDQLMIANIAVQVIKLIATIGLVLAGYSYYGLAWGVVIGTIIELFFFRFYKPEIVSWKPRFKGLKPIAKFGIFISLTNIMTRLEATAPDIIIGKVSTPIAVAMYSRGIGFLSFLSEVVSTGILQVAFPHLAKVNREGGNLAEAYTKATLLLGSVVWPVLAVAGIASYPAIMLMFGEQWGEAVPLVSIMTGWAILKSIHTMSTSLFYSSGHEKILLKKQFVMFVTTMVAIITAAPYGLEIIAWSMVAIGLVDFIVCSIALKIAINLRPVTFCKNMLPNVILVLTCFLSAFAIDLILNFQTAPPIYSFLVLAFIMPIVWLTTVFLLKHPIYLEIKPLFNGISKRLSKK
jgi:O-antigen/teichoic acid export membrane protein